MRFRERALMLCFTFLACLVCCHLKSFVLEVNGEKANHVAVPSVQKRKTKTETNYIANICNECVNVRQISNIWEGQQNAHKNLGAPGTQKCLKTGPIIPIALPHELKNI